LAQPLAHHAQREHSQKVLAKLNVFHVKLVPLQQVKVRAFVLLVQSALSNLSMAWIFVMIARLGSTVRMKVLSSVILLLLVSTFQTKHLNRR
jgi:hypothetical protein